MKNNLPTNNAQLLSKKEAGECLERIGLFADDGNKTLFDADKIKVHDEAYGFECHIISQVDIDQVILVDVILVDDRAL